MKRLTLATALAAATFAVSIPAVSFAQSNDTITRAQVKSFAHSSRQAITRPAVKTPTTRPIFRLPKIA
jgi:hypothetical protein